MIDEIIKKLNNELRKTVKGFKAVSVYNIELAQLLFSESLDLTFDVDLISACNLEVVKMKIDIIESAMGIEDTLGDIVTNLKKETHIVVVTENRKFFIYVAVEGEKVDVPSVRTLLNRYKKALNKIGNEALAS